MSANACEAKTFFRLKYGLISNGIFFPKIYEPIDWDSN